MVGRPVLALFDQLRFDCQLVAHSVELLASVSPVLVETCTEALAQFLGAKKYRAEGRNLVRKQKVV